MNNFFFIIISKKNFENFPFGNFLFALLLAWDIVAPLYTERGLRNQ